eukprot:SAG31_NODE_13795_length_846_cov_1.499331_1_plen_149_part_00
MRARIAGSVTCSRSSRIPQRRRPCRRSPAGPVSHFVLCSVIPRSVLTRRAEFGVRVDPDMLEGLSSRSCCRPPCLLRARPSVFAPCTLCAGPLRRLNLTLRRMLEVGQIMDPVTKELDIPWNQAHFGAVSTESSLLAARAHSVLVCGR